MKKAIGVLLICLACEPLATAQDSFETQLKAFQKYAVQAVSQASSRPRDEQRIYSGLWTISNLGDLTVLTNPSTARDLERGIQSVTLLAPDDTKLAQDAIALLSALKREMATQTARQHAELDALFTKVGEYCLGARVPADLDGSLSALTLRMRQLHETNDDSRSNAMARVENAKHFATRWQDYLDAKQAGGSGAAIIQELIASQNHDVAIMPRSALLNVIQAQKAAETESKEQEQARVEAIMTKLQTARSAEEFTEALIGLPPSFLNGRSALRSVLADLLDERQQVRAGLSADRLFRAKPESQLPATDPAYNPALQQALLMFRRETQLAYIRGSIRTDTFPEASEQDTAESYLTRLIELLVAGKKWPETLEAMELLRSGFPQSRPASWLNADIEMIDAYIGAVRLEQAEQYQIAIAAYQRALGKPGRHSPIEDARARIAALEKILAQKASASAAPAVSGPAL